jgi:prepilin-type N-terminal cleavage/methylation domain-containing protein
MEGFTLIELSIVLVVIGLIIGAIFVGRDLIHAAELRATISQIEKLKSAVNTFKLKYNALPGDMRASDAAAFGFAARTGGTGDGNGNGFIEGCGETASLGGVGLGCETVFFWTDLAAAGLTPGSFTTTTDAMIVNLTSSAQFDPCLPSTPIGRSYYLFVYGSTNIIPGTMPGPQNYIELMYPTWTSAVGEPENPFAPNVFPLSPLDAWNIDTKMDDGLPGSGHVLGVQISIIGGTCPGPNTQVIVGSVPGGFSCWDTRALPFTYALTSTAPPSNYPSRTCGLQFDAQF